MKNIFVVAFFGLLAIGLNAQNCTPDPTVVSAGVTGIFPDPDLNPNLPGGTVGIPYTTTVTVLVPADSTIDLSSLIGFPMPPVTVTVDYLELIAPVLLPDGLMAACEPSMCQISGGSNGCMIISGTPTAEGTTPVSITGLYHFTVPASTPVIGGTSQSLPAIFTPYSITITAGSVGFNDQVTSGEFSVYPNPFENEITFCYNSPEENNIVSVYDATGKLIEKGTAGNRTFNTRLWEKGVYYFRIEKNGKLVESGSLTKE